MARGASSMKKLNRGKFFTRTAGLLFFLFVSCLILASQAQANIVLKLIAANPSKTQEQKVPIKAYLPKETKPENILSKDDLEVAYDTQQGSYYVYGEYDLKPGELLEKNVELMDIWTIPSSEIESLRLEVVKLGELLKNSEYADRVKFLKDSIDSKLNQIVDNQTNAPANPERHISDYRENLRILESAKADLVLVRTLGSQAKSLPAIMIWRTILAILIFLGVLALSFYFIWHKQLKSITETFPAGKEDTSSSVKTSGPAQYDAQADQSKAPAEDIEKIMKKEEK
jgi:predicted HicB family RNase H-like nuclease